MLTDLLKERIAGTDGLAQKIANRTELIGKKHNELRAQWRKDAEEDWESEPMTVGRLRTKSLGRAIVSSEQLLSVSVAGSYRAAFCTGEAWRDAPTSDDFCKLRGLFD